MRTGSVQGLRLKGSDADAFAMAYHALQSLCFGGTDVFWFGWQEIELQLPKRFHPDALLPQWDVVRIFSAEAELRAQRAGKSRIVLLLTEDNNLLNQAATLLQEAFDCTNVSPQPFTIEKSRRYLVGKRSKKITQQANALIEVAFPRELDYDTVPVADGEILFAKVWCYYDGIHRLRYVRYCSFATETERIP